MSNDTPPRTSKSLLLKLDASLRFVLPLDQQNKIRSVINDLLTTARKEARAEAFKDATTALIGLPVQGTMNYRRGYEEGVRDAIRTLEAAASTKETNDG